MPNPSPAPTDVDQLPDAPRLCNANKGAVVWFYNSFGGSGQCGVRVFMNPFQNPESDDESSLLRGQFNAGCKDIDDIAVADRCPDGFYSVAGVYCMPPPPACPSGTGLQIVDHGSDLASVRGSTRKSDFWRCTNRRGKLASVYAQCL